MANAPFHVRHGLNVNNQTRLASNGEITSGNSTVNAVVSTTGFSVGNATIKTAANSSVFSASNNVFLSSTSLNVGNSSVNTTLNSTAFAINGAIGTNGQYLKSDGVVSDWESLSIASGLTFITSANSTSATAINFTNCFNTTYDTYLIMLSKVLNVANDVSLCLRFYQNTTTINSTSGQYQDYIDGANTKILLSYGSSLTLKSYTDAAGGLSGIVHIFNVNANQYKTVMPETTWEFIGTTDGASDPRVTSSLAGTGGVFLRNTVTGFSLFMSSGNISGIVKVYGYNKT